MTQSTSRTAKPVSYYASTPAIAQLSQQYGDYLEKLTPQQRCLFGAALLDHMAAEELPGYDIRESLNSVDPDCILGDRLSDLIVQITNDSFATDLASLLSAIVALIGDDARNGAWD